MRSNKKSIKHESEKIPSEWYCIEYCDVCDDSNILLYKCLDINAKDALYRLYEYLNCTDGVIEKAITSQETIEDGIHIFNKLSECRSYRLVNIYTIDNWVYSTEVEEDYEHY